MACKTICRLCKRLILSQSVTYASGVLTIDIPTGVYASGEKYCIVVAQPIPATTILNAPVIISINGTGTYPLVTKCCEQVVASAIRTRTRYSTTVVTNATGGSFRLMGDLPITTVINRETIP